MKISVAIACNLIIILVNCYLILQLPKWRKLLRNLRLKLVQEERKIQADMDEAVTNMGQLQNLTNSLENQKQTAKDYISQAKLVLLLYRLITVRKFIWK
ncbi:MAG: hypothetical protein WBB82_04915 [Limnothrix sp.]